MYGVSWQVWFWMTSATCLMILSAWAMLDATLDRRKAERAGVLPNRSAVIRVAQRHMRIGAIAFTIAILAGYLALMLIYGTIAEERVWVQRFRDVLAYILNAILWLVLLIVAWDRYDRYLFWHPNVRGPIVCARESRLWSRIQAWRSKRG